VGEEKAQKPVTPERYYLAPSERKQGAKWNWPLIKADYLYEQRVHGTSLEAFGRKVGIAERTLQKRSKGEGWQQEGRDNVLKEVKEMHDPLMVQAAEELQRSLKIMTSLNKLLEQKLKGERGKKAALLKSLKIPMLNSLARTAETVFEGLRLFANQPTLISANAEFRYTIVRAEAPYARHVPRDGVSGLGAGGAGSSVPVSGDLRGVADSKDRSADQMAVTSLESVAEGIRGVVSGADVPAGESE